MLPEIATRQEYLELFPLSELWEGAVTEIARLHDISGEPERGLLGSNIVYRVGSYWIKLFAPLFQNEFEIEVAGLKLVQGLAVLRVPEILAEGVFDKWPFMILSHVEGIRIGDLWPTLISEKKAHLAMQFAKITQLLQGLTPPAKIAQRYQWNTLIKERLTEAVPSQLSKGFPSQHVQKLEAFVSQFSTKEFECAKPVYLHADLTHDHFLVDPSGTRIVGLIDFADSMTGHPEYELIAFFCFLLKSEKKAQKKFFEIWSAPISPRRMLMWIILHRFSDLNRYFGHDAFDRYSNLNDFAADLFI